MPRKVFALLVISILLISGLVVHARGEPVPPQGFFQALADVNTKIGQSISLVCSNPSDGSTCSMSNVQLDWEWEFATYSDASLGCPTTQVAAQVQTSAYRYYFGWQGVNYEYRQTVPNGAVQFCGSNGLQSLGTTSPPPVIATPQPAQTTGGTACAGGLAPRLSVGGRGRVTPGDPNNIRAQPGTKQANLGQIPGGAEFDVLAGPSCADGINYWQVRYQGTVGWTGEGKGSVYWTEPLSGTSTTGSSFTLSGDSPLITATNASQLHLLTSIKGIAPLAWSGYGLVAISGLVSNNVSQDVLVYDIGALLPDPDTLKVGSFIQDLAFNPTGSHLNAQLAVLTLTPTATTNPMNVQMWDAFTATQIFSIQVSEDAQHIAYSPDGMLLAVSTGSLFGDTTIFTIDLYNTQTGQLVGSLQQDAYVSGMAFSSVGTNFVSGSDNSQIMLWDVPTRSLIATLPATPSSGSATITFSPIGSTFAFGSSAPSGTGGLVNFFVDIWDINTRTQIRKLPAAIEITGLDFSADGSLLAMSQSGIQARSGNESVQVWDVTSGAQLINIPVLIGAVRDASFSDDGTLLFYANGINQTDSLIQVYGVSQ